MQANYLSALLLLFIPAQAAPQSPKAQVKTVYISKKFKTITEAQRVLSRDAFFLFDIHGVLFDNQGKYLKVFQKVKNKKKFFKQGIKALFSKKARTLFKKRQKEGDKITERKFDTVKEFAHLHSELIDFSNNIFSPNLQMKRLLMQLKNNGYELYLLSNIGNVTLERLVRQHPTFFSLMTDTQNTINRTATQTGLFVWKPRLDTFTQSLATIKKSHHAHLAIFVDDQIDNILAAHKAGFNAIYFTSYPQFYRDVANLIKK